MTYGGLPRILSMQTDEQKSKYLIDTTIRYDIKGKKYIVKLCINISA